MSEETRAIELELYAALTTHDEAEERERSSEGLEPLPLTRGLTLELASDGA
jgi:hypothetical protein